MVRATRATANKKNLPPQPTASDNSIVAISDVDLALISRCTTFYNPEEEAAYNRFTKYETKAARYVDWAALKTLGIDSDVRDLFEAAGLENFAKINEPAFAELTYEFLATFKNNRHIISKTDKNRYEFRLMGVDMSMSLNMFNAYLGVVEMKEFESEANRGSSVGFPGDFNAADFWKELTGADEYDPSNAKSSQLPDHPLRFVQKYLASTLFSRATQSNVPKNDLLVLWAMKNNRRVNVAYWLGLHIANIASTTASTLLCGHFITKIARGMGMFNPRVQKLTLLHNMEKFDCACMKRLNICHKVNNKWVLYNPEQDAGTSQVRKREFDTFGSASVLFPTPDPKRRLVYDTAHPIDPADVSMKQIMGLVA